MTMNHGLEITKDGTLIVTLPRGMNIRQVIVQEEKTFIGNLFIKEGTDNIKKHIDAINAEIDAVPVDKDGFYSPGSQMFVMGLIRAREVVERFKKE